MRHFIHLCRGVVKDGCQQAYVLCAWVKIPTLLSLWSLIIGQCRSLPAEEFPTLVGHQAPVYAAVFTPDGLNLISASFDRTLRLWDVSARTTRRVFSGHTGLVLSVALSPDARQCASGSLDNSIRLWDIPQARAEREWQAGNQSAHAFLAVNGWLVTGGEDRKLRVYQAADGGVVHEIEIPAPIARVAVRNDQQQLAAADTSGRVWVYQADGRFIGVWGAHPEGISGLVYAANNGALLTAGDKWVKRWPVQFPPRRSSRGHTAPVLHIQVSPNNAWVVSAGQEPGLRLWNYNNAELARTWEDTGGRVVAVTWMNDGNRLVAAGEDKKLRLFQASDGQLLTTLPEMTEEIRGLTVAPNQQHVAVGLASGTIKLLNLPQGEEVRQWPAHEGGITALMYHPQQPVLFSAGEDRQAKLWDSEGKLQRSWEHPARITALAVSWDGQWVATGSDDHQVRLFPLADGQSAAVLTGHRQRITHVDFSRDHQRLLTCSMDGTCRVWHLPSQRLLQFFSDEQLPPLHAACWSPDNQTVVYGGEAALISYDVVSVSMVHQADEQRVQSLNVHPNGSWHVTGGSDGRVTLWDSGSGNPIRQFSGHQGAVQAVAIRPDQQQLASGGTDQKLILWNINDPSKPHYVINTPAAVTLLAYSHDSKKLLAAGSDHLLRSYVPDPPNPPPPQPPSQDPAQITDGHPAPVIGLGFSQDSRHAWSVSTRGQVRMWRIAAPTATAVLNGHQGGVYAVVWHPDGKRLISASQDKTIRFWDLSNGQTIRDLPAQGGPIYALALTPDGQHLLSAGGDKTVRVYRVEDGSELRQLTGPTDAVYSVCVPPEGTLAAAAGLDRKIFVWDINSGQLLQTLTGHQDDIYRVEFVPSTNRKLVSVGYAGWVHFWDLQQSSPLASQHLPGVMYNLAISPRGERLAVMGNDSKMILLDMPASAR
ncbi:MAG: hypothetical protein KatS3mg113_0536 [Planctomycetaceae bacterium]|nr:MAG: hypothetical protein KatS3mg113_0536 [Planctomycetaceae bacterium]